MPLTEKDFPFSIPRELNTVEQIARHTKRHELVSMFTMTKDGSQSKSNNAITHAVLEFVDGARFWIDRETMMSPAFETLEFRLVPNKRH